MSRLWDVPYTRVTTHDADASPSSSDSGEVVTSGDVSERCPGDPQAYAHFQCASAVLLDSVQVDPSPIHLETSSVYGGVVLLPQLGRCIGWRSSFVLLTMKVYLLAFGSFFLQALLLLEISREQSVMDLFAGQIYLCDFGAPVYPCPADPSCAGPGGTRISESRLYDFKTWTTRVYVRDALKTLFPDRASDIEEQVDPGEYGSESRITRWLCCFILVLELMQEFRNIVMFVRVLYHIPTGRGTWFDLKKPGEMGGAGTCTHGPSHGSKRVMTLDDVSIRIAGMPLVWKVVNCCLVLVPKIGLWKLMAEVGVVSLMETSTIDNIITNCVALTFILKIDETVCAVLLPAAAQRLMDRVEDYHLTVDLSAVHPHRRHVVGGPYCSSENERAPRDGFVKRKVRRAMKMLDVAFPIYLLIALAISCYCIGSYYVAHCQYSDEWKFWHSQPIWMPDSARYNFLNLLFPSSFPVGRVNPDTPLWTMPNSG